MAAITEDFGTIENIIKHEIHRRKKQKKTKKNLKYVEEDNISLLKRKKKKEKKDKLKVHNNNNLKIDKTILKKQKFYSETCDDSDKHLKKDKTGDSIFNKDELTRKIPTANTSEGDSLSNHNIKIREDIPIKIFKKKKKKKKRDTAMVQNGEHFSNNIVTLQVEKFCNETCDDNVNFYEDELTRSIPIANDSEGDPLFKKKKKKKNRDKKMVQKDKHLKEDTSILNVVQFYNETIDDNVKYLNKINISAPNLNKEDFTTIIQIANASEDDEELTLLKSPFKKIKRKKKKSKMEINDGTQSSKYVTIQKNLKNMEDLKKNVSKEQSNEIHNDSGMINNPYNSRISKVHEQYPELFRKILKQKKKNKKKSIEVVTIKEAMPPKKSNKHKREVTDKEYSKNNSSQSMNLDVQTYDSNNYISGKKLELFYSQGDHTSEYRTMTDIDANIINTIYNSRISKVHKEDYPEVVKKSLKNKNREQKKAIKAVTRNEVMLQKKSTKHKRQTIDKEYSKNDSPQSVDINVETCYDTNNYIGEDFGNKLELFDSRDDRPSEYRNITDTVMYLGQYCNQIFNNANGVFIHENVLTGNIPVQCDICFRTFSCKSSLNIHKRTHTGEKPYMCNVCGRSFSQKGSCVVHYRIHTGERPFGCYYCEKKFSVSHNRASHIRRIHTNFF